MRPLALPHWPNERWERFTARTILVLWAAFWIWFGVASALSEGLPTAGIVAHAALPGLLFAAIALLAWRSERAAGILLLAIAGMILLAYDSMMGQNGLLFVLEVGSILAGPPALAGLLFLMAYHHDQRR